MRPSFQKADLQGGSGARTDRFQKSGGAPVAQWVKRWPTDLADIVRSSLEVKSSQRSSTAHSLSLSFEHRPDMTEILLKRM